MPKAILEFNLPEEQEEYKLTLKAGDWMMVCSEMDNWLRNRIKYENRNDLQEVRDVLLGLMNEYEVHNY